MSPSSRLLAASAILATLLVPTSAAAAPKQASATGNATVLRPLTVVKQADLDFGALIVTGAGTAVINPVTNVLTTTGPVTPVGSAAAHRATFTTTGSKNSIVIIHVPNGTTTLTRVGGGGTMTISNWTLDGPVNRRFPQNSAFNFSVGGTLNIGAGQADGVYAGTFAVTVQYP